MTRPGTPALVLGAGITALGVVRALGRRGVKVAVLGPRGDLAAHSRYAAAIRDPGALRAAEADLAHWLHRSHLGRLVLVPCSDRWAGRVADLPEEFRSDHPASVPLAGTLAQMTDKALFAALAARTGVSHPATWPVDSAQDLEQVPDSAWSRAFLKPRDSQAFFQTFGVKAFWVRSRDEARRRLAETALRGLVMQVQSWVPGPPSNHVFVDGFVDAGGEIRAIFVRRRLRMYPPDFGNSTFMESVAPADEPGAVDTARRLLAGVRYRGVFSLETKRHADDGAYYALEVNARPWWYVEFAARCGVDVSWLAYRDALGEPVDSVMEYSVGRRCVYPYYDWAAIRALGPTRPTHLGWLREVAGAAQPVWSAEDPIPSLMEVTGLIARAVHRRVVCV